mmetsp:Transcript_14397/g.34650  ORF Transcript_14397/g.34650 Transcript_14397/m.34650 type:complete len:216 (+) Transcript_14397:3837-4484(+)
MLRRLLGARLHVFVERVPVSAEDFITNGAHAERCRKREAIMFSLLPCLLLQQKQVVDDTLQYSLLLPGEGVQVLGDTKVHAVGQKTVHTLRDDSCGWQSTGDPSSRCTSGSTAAGSRTTFSSAGSTAACITAASTGTFAAAWKFEQRVHVVCPVGGGLTRIADGARHRPLVSVGLAVPGVDNANHLAQGVRRHPASRAGGERGGKGESGEGRGRC